MLKKAPNLKKIVKSKTKSNINVRLTSEAMLELIPMLFLKNLAKEAKAKSFEEKSATIKPRHVKAVSKKMLKKARG
ncbi:centromere protein W [Nerophis lumbriciformis]|uniref:centromere protein W n=1 Tax=Nerophis lumbriciformis TaxID=546530 RepID=UPI002ADF996C|nr:centromere protein W-like [Nerophis lumbriciformis]